MPVCSSEDRKPVRGDFWEGGEGGVTGTLAGEGDVGWERARQGGGGGSGAAILLKGGR